MIDWLMLPLSGRPDHAIEAWAYWHARSMVIGWGVLLPLGALAARYFKITPRQRWPEELDNKAWWHAHRTLQWAGVLLVTLGVGIVWGHGQAGSLAARLHAWAGWAVLAMAWLQVVTGLRRGTKGGPSEADLRGDHYDMTPHRVRFERLHKSIGWLSVLLAVAVIGLGLHLADAPRWMAVALLAWWALLAVFAARLQVRGRCIDTYQAIWGPDPRHPGNRIKPIGLGVRRPQA